MNKMDKKYLLLTIDVELNDDWSKGGKRPEEAIALMEPHTANITVKRDLVDYDNFKTKSETFLNAGGVTVWRITIPEMVYRELHDKLNLGSQSPKWRGDESEVTHIHVLITRRLTKASNDFYREVMGYKEVSLVDNDGDALVDPIQMYANIYATLFYDGNRILLINPPFDADSIQKGLGYPLQNCIVTVEEISK